MSYATKQNMIDRFSDAELVELTDRAVPAAGVINDTVLNEVLADADDMINGYIGKRYALPLATTPSMVTRLAADIARYYLYKDDAPEYVETAYREAIKFLSDVSTGKAILDAAGAEPDSADDGLQTSGPDRTFSRTTMKGY